ncbi:MAG: hypothetical protein DWQ37_20580 [Planctomycetota bacterium]|nr:MAG: hypothetical protein DWQ37_20580 [Planctomycetota bacterium]
MNTVGKILVLLIFAASVTFMGWAVAVYGTHQDWKKKYEDESAKVQIAQTEVGRLEEEQKQIQEELQAEITAREQALAKLETEAKALAEERAELVKQRDALQAKDKQAVAALDAAQKNLERLTGEVEDLRNDIREAQGDRDTHFDRVVELTDQIHQIQGEVRRLDERGMQLASQLASAKLVLDRHGLHKDMPVDGIPPRLRGKVLAVNRDNMIEVSLGTDDGLRAGHTLEIFRGTKYLGRLEVLQATTDRAVGKVIPGFKKGVIRKDDDVATRFS